ncbi:MAG: FtsX-like permease family protein [Ruminococcaceae bacterium]|nr:FtsX-like permease family protein [Oscillospiraceae bacterium]
MKISDLFRFSVDNLRRRKGRTVLTVIGVVVGVCAIVVMMSLGIAVNLATDEMLQNWGDLTKITVQSYGAQQGTPDLDDDMVTKFKALDHVVAATPMYYPSFYGSVTAGNNNRYEASWANVIGMDADALEPMGYELVTGNWLDGQNLGKDKIQVMLGVQSIFNFTDSRLSWNNPNKQKYPEYDTEEAMYSGIPSNLPQYDENGTLLNPENFFFDPMTSKLTYRLEVGYDDEGNPKYKDYELVVTGLINSNNDWDIRYGVVMSMTDVKKIEADYKRLTGQSSGGGGGVMYSSSFGMDTGDTVNVGGYNNVYVKVDNVSNMPAVEKQIREIGYQLYSMSSEREQIQGQVAQTQMMMGALGLVSLLVAALNIANTMTMAIYERTKEIGVMKVLGCKLGNIREMFLIESGAIGLVGGLLGVVLSYLLSLLLNYLPQIMTFLGIEGNIDIAGMFGLSYMSQMMPDMQLSIIPIWLVVVALVFATVVGLLSGIAPANRAVKISSLEAIRHE